MLKKVTIVLSLLFLMIFTGCNNIDSNDQKITKEEASQIVINERSRDCCDDAEILSITSEPDKYIINWEIESINESGKDSIHKQTGRLKLIESSRGACKLK